MQNQQDNMSNYTITSPISGTIIEKDAKQGDALTSGSTLCVIYDLSYLEMVINVDELHSYVLTVSFSLTIGTTFRSKSSSNVFITLRLETGLTMVFFVMSTCPEF